MKRRSLTKLPVPGHLIREMLGNPGSPSTWRYGFDFCHFTFSENYAETNADLSGTEVNPWGYPQHFPYLESFNDYTFELDEELSDEEVIAGDNFFAFRILPFHILGYEDYMEEREDGMGPYKLWDSGAVRRRNGGGHNLVTCSCM